MRIAIIGAGAMGMLYGAYLSKKNDVVMLTHTKVQADIINKNGISVEENDGETVLYNKLRAYKSGEFNWGTEFVIILVKATQTKEAMELNKSLFGENTLVMTLQNGEGNDRIISEYTLKKNIIIGTSKHNSINIGNGRIKHPGAGITIIGSDEVEDNQLNDICRLMSDCGFETTVSDSIKRIIWEKLLVNVAINAFTSITQTPTGFICENLHAWKFVEMLVDEAINVAKAENTEFKKEDIMKAVKSVCKHVGMNGYSSMYQDRKKGINTEIDAINGAIARNAKRHGISAPCNALVTELVHAIENSDNLQTAGNSSK